MKTTQSQNIYNEAMNEFSVSLSEKMDLSRFKSLYRELHALSEKLNKQDKKFEHSTMISRVMYLVLYALSVAVMLHSAGSVIALGAFMPFQFSWRMLAFFTGFLSNASIFLFVTHFFYLRSHVGHYTRIQEGTTIRHDRVKFSLFPKFIRKYCLSFDKKVLLWLEKKYHASHKAKTEHIEKEVLTCSTQLLTFTHTYLAQMHEYLIENAPLMTLGIDKEELAQNMTYMKNLEQFKLGIENDNIDRVVDAFAQCLMLHQDKEVETSQTDFSNTLEKQAC